MAASCRTASFRAKIVYSCRQYRRQMVGLQVPRNIYIAICGTDLIRLENGEFVVLEDEIFASPAESAIC